MATSNGQVETPGPAHKADTRRVERLMVPQGTSFEADGIRGRLIDISALGAQVVTREILRPKERVRLTLRRNGHTIRTDGVIVWSAMELVGARARYRAGIEFGCPVAELSVDRLRQVAESAAASFPAAH